MSSFKQGGIRRLRGVRKKLFSIKETKHTMYTDSGMQKVIQTKGEKDNEKRNEEAN